MRSNGAPPSRWAVRLAWTALAGVTAAAAAFLVVTLPLLPQRVAVHFDESGRATAYLSLAAYRGLVWAGVAVPLVVAVGMHALYARVRTVRLPNYEYWMAPARLGATRLFLQAHAVWLGVLLTLLTCFMHWLIVSANALEPPQLATQVLLVGAIVALACMATWVAALSLKFRRVTG